MSTNIKFKKTISSTATAHNPDNLYVLDTENPVPKDKKEDISIQPDDDIYFIGQISSMARENISGRIKNEVKETHENC